MLNFLLRYIVFFSVFLVAVLFVCLAIFNSFFWWIVAVPFSLLFLLGVIDLFQMRYAVRRNYPVIGNLRYLFQYIRPEIRQYFMENDDQKIPFSRAERILVQQRSGAEQGKQPFGTQLDLYKSGYEWMNHSMSPTEIKDAGFRITIGGPECKKPYSASVFNISGMSFGALSASAVLTLNRGAALGGFFHNTGEGGVSKYHKKYGGDLTWNIGSGYFGCRDEKGRFSPEKFAENAQNDQIKMIEIKLSQGAKPGQGGVVPAAKVTPEIAAARGIPVGEDCLSPSQHTAFSTPIELLEFVAQLRDLSGGKPIGIKLAIGHPWEWFAIAKAMLKTKITPDFIVVDGAEGGTATAPIEFMDHVGVPLVEALRLVHNTLVGIGVRGDIKIGASGKIISAFDVARIMALGADWCNSARGFMFSIGCIQALVCHTGKCPTGITTQDPLRQKALVVSDKSLRVANYHRNTLKALAELLSAAGLTHPSELRPHHIARRTANGEIRVLSALFPDLGEGGLLEGTYEQTVFRTSWPMSTAESFQPLYSLSAAMSALKSITAPSFSSLDMVQLTKMTELEKIAEPEKIEELMSSH